ncbi:MAG: sigma 54-interacting transcriptional regulator [SAR324 cluster bacterium]|nr:sigma 54-interacting transcriptional regulator [SAR324 cluster bacterium]
MTEKNIKQPNAINIPTDSILESISDGVFTVDDRLKITFFNRSAEKITGVSREDALGMSCAEVFRSSMCETECALKQTMDSNRQIVDRHGYIVNSAGDKIPISLSTAVLRESNGKIIGGAETFRDLSEIEALKQEIKGRFSLGDLISHSSTMMKVFELASAVSVSSSTVVIQGETGTGKELLARAIHNLGSHAKAPFIAVNCGAIPDTLLESELFGYKKGAFTGADKDKPGRFALAENGTLFLDEIGEISPALQVRLLRVLQEHCYEPLGATTSVQTEARIIVATNRDLESMVQKGEFRQDLFYRLNVITIELPPLRQRKEDIPALVDHFVKSFNVLQNKTVSGVTDEVLVLLMSHDWPGNIRELENVIERAFVLCSTKWISVEHLPKTLTGLKSPVAAVPNMESVKHIAEEQSILKALQRNHYNRAAAARELGIHKTTLYRKIKSLNISIPDENNSPK